MYIICIVHSTDTHVVMENKIWSVSFEFLPLKTRKNLKTSIYANWKSSQSISLYSYVYSNIYQYMCTYILYINLRSVIPSLIARGRYPFQLILLSSHRVQSIMGYIGLPQPPVEFAGYARRSASKIVVTPLSGQRPRTLAAATDYAMCLFEPMPKPKSIRTFQRNAKKSSDIARLKSNWFQLQLSR